MSESWVSGLFHNYYCLICILVLVFATYHLLHALLSDRRYTQTLYNQRGHTWRSIQCNKAIPYNILCSVCGKLMLPTVGLFCECCGVSACKHCVRRVRRRTACKPTSVPLDKPVLHNWVKVGSSRDECVDHTDDLFQDYYCCWCQRVRHFSNRGPDTAKVCDYGEFRNLIIPPTHVTIEKGNITIKQLPSPDWEPIIVLANKKSGSNKGDEALSLFRGLLNPIQVVDLSSTPPEAVVRWLPARCRVLVAGGDGTVAWVLNALAGASVKAPVAILPLGTGNDLSRVLGWGASSSDVDAHAVLRSVAGAREQLLDRWKIVIKPKSSRLGRRGERTLFAYNYASIGVDAQVALDFHRARSQFLYRYTNRSINYMAYLCFGATRALDDAGCFGLERRLSVRVDAARARLALPPVQALVLLNIPSWGAGVDLWKTGGLPEDVDEQRVDDKKIEVVGISSSFHIARLQCGLAQPHRFAQATSVELELSGACAMQVDGEPWLQRAAAITLQHAGVSTLLRRTD